MSTSSTVIGADTIDRLLKSDEAKAVFPFLARPPQIKRGGCCGRRAKYTVNYNAIKRSIAGLADTQKKQLLSILNTTNAVMHYKVGTQKKTDYL